jgi:thioredoxin 1
VFHSSNETSLTTGTALEHASNAFFFSLGYGNPFDKQHAYSLFSPYFSILTTPRGIAMSERIHHVTDSTFESEGLQSSQPVILDFWAEWCGPCKMVAPILDEIAEQYAERLKVAKIDVDSNPATPAKFAVRGIPTLILFKNGNVEATKVGALSKSQLAEFIDSHL